VNLPIFYIHFSCPVRKVPKFKGCRAGKYWCYEFLWLKMQAVMGSYWFSKCFTRAWNWSDKAALVNDVETNSEDRNTEE